MPNKLGGLQYLNAAKAAAYKAYLISSDEDGDSDCEEYTKASKRKEAEKTAKKKANKKSLPRSKKTAKAPSKTVSKLNASVENIPSSSGEEESVHFSSEEEARTTIIKEIPKKEEKEESQSISNKSTKELPRKNCDELCEDLKKWTKTIVPEFEASKEETNNILRGKFSL